MIEFRVLGHLQVLNAGNQLKLTGEMRCRLLAVLLSEANRPVRVDVLIDALWDGEPPRSARKGLQVYVHRLRRTVGLADRINYGSNSYSIWVETAELDAMRFTDLVRRARIAQRAGYLEEASGLYRAGLDLWRGPAYADIHSVITESHRLEELRLQAWEDCFDVELMLGRRDDMITELTMLIAEHPFRERLRAQLMAALYKAERQAEALKVFHETRTLFADEFGIAPGARLHALHSWIREAVSARAGQDLRCPSSLLGFVGRAEDLYWLSALLNHGDGSEPVNVEGPSSG
ncbi:AfsR/SARP family transcriptional regulator [Nonomuraea mesophila]|uniref:AfsR/SARP family transcriptional regulator n=1 Tax=Nonomuraea mesophila TaxID=2530382 RepID=A0A4R5FYA4_9ACTN|nr:AfsR/SARP family transcriptional regulator [Nonomuraea mesophila]TDE59749.1 AfsR/SARP family transcriptional regulator [Nonomuraea mesophila]